MKKKATPLPSPSRRRFAKSVAASLLAAPLATALPETVAAQTPAAAPPNAEKVAALTNMYLEMAKTRFGKQFSDEQLAFLKRDIEGSVRINERFRAVKLANSDEPDFVFNVGGRQ